MLVLHPTPCFFNVAAPSFFCPSFISYLIKLVVVVTGGTMLPIKDASLI
jgi:hypothetical protein